MSDKFALFDQMGVDPGVARKPPNPAPIDVVPEPPLKQEPDTVMEVRRDEKKDVGAKLFGVDLFGESMAPKAGGRLAERFMLPPFSVLNAREGVWQERKRAWLTLEIKGEEGRGDGGVIGGSALHSFKLGPDGKTVRSGQKLGHDDTREGTLYASEQITTKNLNYYREQEKNKLGMDSTRNWVLGINSAARMQAKYAKEVSITLDQSTSVFDPVLCELVYKWFCPAKGQILDPFGGEATKGIVATVLGYDYLAVEVRQEQVDANNAQAERIKVAPRWVCGDSSQLDSIVDKSVQADLVFTSPPYFDLEVYSDDEADGSAFSDYGKFMTWYEQIFAQCVGRMKTNRFLVVKVGEIRDDAGIYRNFVGDNITCFKRLGLLYYNEIILVTSAGSLPIRAGKQFASGRKIGKTHQNVLVFVKGDPKKAANACGEIEWS